MVEYELDAGLAAKLEGVLVDHKIVVVGQGHAALFGVAGTQADKHTGLFGQVPGEVVLPKNSMVMGVLAAMDSPGQTPMVPLSSQFSTCRPMMTSMWSIRPSATSALAPWVPSS